MTIARESPVHGTVSDGFEPVRDAFAANFTSYGDVGASLCVYVDGRQVVDVWGGVTEPGGSTPYDDQTLQLVFSTTKGATALCAHVLADRGLLDLDAPVSDVWPEFAAQGKGAVTIRELMGHRAGLAAFAEKISLEDFLAWEPAVEQLAAQAPNWPLGDGHGYHALTFGHLVGEVVRRIDGRSLGTFFAEEIAAPLGLEFYIGLPAELEERVSPLHDFVMPPPGAVAKRVISSDGAEGPPTVNPMVTAMATKGTLTHQVFSRPRLLLPQFNDHAVREAEVPAANGITNARSLARMYASIIGEIDGFRAISAAQVEQARTLVSKGPDKVLILPNRIGAGFFLNSITTPLTSPRAFGHSGMGGSLGFCDPERGIAFGYAMNQCVAWPAVDPRTNGLIHALSSVVGAS